MRRGARDPRNSSADEKDRHLESDGAQEALDRLADRFVIVDDGDNALCAHTHLPYGARVGPLLIRWYNRAVVLV